MKKRYLKGLSILISLLLLLSIFAGCDQNKDQQSDLANAPVQQTQEEIDSSTESAALAMTFGNLKEEDISVEHAMEIIKELISEKYLGRQGGTKENKLAEEYMANYFKEIGLENPQGLENYKQPFDHKITVVENVPSMKLLDSKGVVVKEFNYLTDYLPNTRFSDTKIEGKATGTLEVVHNINQLESLQGDMKGKILLLGEALLQNGKMQESMHKLLSMEEKVKGVILPSTPNKEGYLTVANYTIRFRMISSDYNNEDGPMVMQCSTDVFKELIEVAKTEQKLEMSLSNTYQNVQPSNIIGLLPGVDPELKDEYIIISAHMDHMGDNKNGTYNPGAFDNASGTAVMMELAKILKESDKKPKRSILFIAFNSEEGGLIGSTHYTNNPLYPLEKCRVVNVDMVGSKETVPFAIASRAGKVREMFETYAQGFKMDYEKIERVSSDHVPFEEKGVDAVTISHGDMSRYHSIKDDINAVSPERLKEVIKITLYYLDQNAY